MTVLTIADQVAASAAYYSDEWPFGDEHDPELQAIIKALCTREPVRRWFDLGSGPMGPLWLPFIRPKHATLSDLHGEHLCFAQHRLHDIRSGRWLPVEERAARQAAARWGDTPTPTPWVACDVAFSSLDLDRLQLAPAELGAADLVTAIGSLGCLPSMARLETALFWLSQTLHDGRLVAAFWLGPQAQESEKYAAWPHLYYSDCVTRDMTLNMLMALVCRYFTHVTENVLDLGGGRHLCVADMHNRANVTTRE